jgi:hypothetical protein
MKKLIIILTNVFLLTISTSSCAMSGNIKNTKQEITKENFSFKNYKNEEDAQKDLLKLFPIGSNISELVGFLENKKECKFESILGENRNNIFDASKRFITCSYKQKINFIIRYNWDIVIEKNTGNSLISVGITKQYFGS